MKSFLLRISMHFNNRLYLMFILLFLSTPVFAQVFTDVELPNPRLTAIGASTGLTGDPAQILSNPAGIIGLKSFSGSASFTKPFDQNFYSLYYASSALPLPKNYGVAGIGVINGGVNFGGVSLSNETAVALGHAFYLQRDIQTSFAFGYSLKFLSQSFGTSVTGHSLGSDQSIGIDVGVSASLWQRTQIGFRVSNINRPTMGSVVENELPSVVNGCIGYRPYRGVYTGIELERTLGKDQIIKAGTELEIDSHLDLRLGIRSNPNRVAIGFGIKNIAKIRADYTYLTHPSLSPTHLIGLSYGF